MPAGAVGASWRAGSWPETAWEAGSWSSGRPRMRLDEWFTVPAVGRVLQVEPVTRTIEIPAVGRSVRATRSAASRRRDDS